MVSLLEILLLFPSETLFLSKISFLLTREARDGPLPLEMTSPVEGLAAPDPQSPGRFWVL